MGEPVTMNSKIFKKIEDQNKLLVFFTQKQVESVNLPYRASENQFLASKFHDKCDNVPNNLVLVETEHGNLIGGFTAFAWKSGVNGNVPGTVNSPDHFVFSLTNNHKFTLTQNPQCCLSFDDSYGPIFGDGHDFCIQDKANENNISYTIIGKSYTNPNYTQGDSKSDERFGGGENFKIKEWELWKVNFKK